MINNANHDVENEIIYNKDVLKSNLFDASDANILVIGDINVAAAPATQVSFKIVHYLLNVSQKLMPQQ